VADWIVLACFEGDDGKKSLLF